jgi:hypothetical protein
MSEKIAPFLEWFLFWRKVRYTKGSQHKQGASMKYLRYTLLMILITALIMPSPSVLAVGDTGSNMKSEGGISQTIDKSTDNMPPSKDLTTDTPPSQLNNDPKQNPDKEQSSPEKQPEVNPPTAEPPKQELQMPSHGNDSLDNMSQILISKVSPDKKYIEIYNPTDSNVKLAGWKIEHYKADVKTGGKEFKDEVILANDFLVLSNDPALTKAVKFDKAPSMIQSEGSVVLSRADGSTADVVGWGEAKKFLGAPATGGVKTVWRCFANGLIIDSKNNLADFSSNKTADDQEVALYARPQCKAPEPPKPVNKCEGLKLNEIASHVDEPFIELVNVSDKAITTAGCKVEASGSNSQEVLGGVELKPGELWAVKVKRTKLKLPKMKGKVRILDEASAEIDVTEYDKMPKGASWSLLDGEWMQTFAVTENAANVFKEYADCQSGYERSALGKCVKISVPPAASDVLVPCPTGQYRHPETRRCRKIETAKTVTPCKEGYYRSEATGRCRSIASAAAKTLKPCPDGQFRNPATGRCKKIAAADDIPKDCPEGFERNPTTRRCRKIKTASIPVVGSATARVQHVAGATWGWWVFGGVSLLAVGYGAWQWRWELSQLIRKLRR